MFIYRLEELRALAVCMVLEASCGLQASQPQLLDTVIEQSSTKTNIK